MLTPRRIAKLERELALLEAEFRDALITELRRCASGTWGLFGQNDHVWSANERHREPKPEALLRLGEQIADLRLTLGLVEPFALHHRLLKLRGRKGPNVPGEAKLARQWLDE